MRRLSFIILVCLFAVACGTTRKVAVSQESTALSRTVGIDSSFIKREIESAVAERISKSLDIQQMDIIEITQEKFSAPDSTGAVHPTERTVVVYKGTNTVREESAADRETVISEAEETGSKSVVATSEEVRETAVPVDVGRVPAWVRWLARIGAAALLLFLLWLLHKFRII